MKLHCLKDYLAVLISVIGIFLISRTICDEKIKTSYYRQFLVMIILIDGFFVFNRYAYDYDLGSNRETILFFILLCIPVVLLVKYTKDCVSSFG